MISVPAGRVRLNDGKVTSWSYRGYTSVEQNLIDGIIVHKLFLFVLNFIILIYIITASIEASYKMCF